MPGRVSAHACSRVHNRSHSRSGQALSRTAFLTRLTESALDRERIVVLILARGGSGGMQSGFAWVQKAGTQHEHLGPSIMSII